MNRQLSTSISGNHESENLAGEGISVLPRAMMGEGFASQKALLTMPAPSPVSACCKTEQPSPARGEGVIAPDASAAQSWCHRHLEIFW
jgi:hypothetical protein